MPLESRTVIVSGKEIRIHEFTTGGYGEIKDKSVSFVRGKPRVNIQLWDAYCIYHSVDVSTWPFAQEWGQLTPENIMKMPARLTKPLVKAINDLNKNTEDEVDFLDSKSESVAQGTTSSSTQYTSVPSAQSSESQSVSTASLTG